MAKKPSPVEKLIKNNLVQTELGQVARWVKQRQDYLKTHSGEAEARCAVLDQFLLHLMKAKFK